MNRPRRPRLNVKRAVELYDSGRRTFREVGVILAREEGRSTSYAAESVSGAIRKADKARCT